MHRVYRRGQSTPWWFASVPADGPGNRFDLPAPDGACSTATSLAGALVEVFQGFSLGLLPVSEITARVRAEVTAPPSAPRAAQVTAARALAAGVTVALWATVDRPLTQRWAVALRRAGWRALYAGVQHDPTGRSRSVTLFDASGEHDPYDDPDWRPVVHELAGDAEVVAALARYGLEVVDDQVDLPVVIPPGLRPAGPGERRTRRP
jgi:hypothetical protein